MSAKDLKVIRAKEEEKTPPPKQPRRRNGSRKRETGKNTKEIIHIGLLEHEEAKMEKTGAEMDDNGSDKPHEAKIMPLHPQSDSDPCEKQNTLKDYLGSDFFYSGRRYIDHQSHCTREQGIHTLAFDLETESWVSFSETKWDEVQYTSLSDEKKERIKELRKEYFAKQNNSAKGQQRKSNE